MRALREQRPGDVGAERLEPALGVAVVAEQHGVGEQVDHPSADLAQPPGPHERRRLGVAPAADDHVPAVLDLGEQPDELRRRVGEVGVGEGDRPARAPPASRPGPRRPCPGSRACTSTWSAPAARAASAGAVARAVVDHHDLELAVGDQRSASSARSRPTVRARCGRPRGRPAPPPTAGRRPARRALGHPRRDVGPHLARTAPSGRPASGTAAATASAGSLASDQRQRAVRLDQLAW